MRCILIILAFMLANPKVLGQTFTIQVTRATVSPCIGGVEFSQTYSNGATASISLSTCATRINVTASSTSVDVGRITLTNGPSAHDVDIIFGTATSINQSDTPSSVVFSNWGGLDTSGMGFPNRARLSASIGGNLTDTVRVGQLFRFDVVGQIQAQIRSTNSGNLGAGIFVIEAGSVTSGGSIVLDNNNVTRVRANTGSILGAITVSNGRIFDVFATNGDLSVNLLSQGPIRNVDVGGNIGASGSPVTITSSGVNGHIDMVRGDNIYAAINTRGVSGTGTGQLRNLRATVGDFVGSIDTHILGLDSNAGDQIIVAGDFDADVTTQGNVLIPVLVSGSLPAGRTISIGARLGHPDYDGRFEFGSNGLGGQIIVNAANNSYPWLGTVKVGSTVIGPDESQPYEAPEYEVASSSLGGGAVGLARFYLYKNDCVPAHDSEVGSLPNDEMVLRFYGPVTLTSGAMPVTVEYRDLNDDIWYDVTEDFDAALGSNDRELIVFPLSTDSPSWGTDREYRITRPGGSPLVCDQVTGNPAVQNFTYLVRVN